MYSHLPMVIIPSDLVLLCKAYTDTEKTKHTNTFLVKDRTKKERQKKKHRPPYLLGLKHDRKRTTHLRLT